MTQNDDAQLRCVGCVHLSSDCVPELVWYICTNPLHPEQVRDEDGWIEGVILEPSLRIPVDCPGKEIRGAD